MDMGLLAAFFLRTMGYHGQENSFSQKKNSHRKISYVGISKISTAAHRLPPITNKSTQTMAPRRQAAKAMLDVTLKN